MAPRDPYEVLGAPREASMARIRRAYRRLPLRHHPDRNADPQAEAAFLEIQRAYQALRGARGRPRPRFAARDHGRRAEARAENSALLRQAAAGGNVALARGCVRAGADLDEADENGWTALCHAAASGDTEIVDLLWEAGAQVAAADDAVPRTNPLDLAVRHEQPAVAEQLIARGAAIGRGDALACILLGMDHHRDALVAHARARIAPQVEILPNFWAPG